MATHELKTWPGPFDAVWRGNKTAELRKLDRDFRVGDTLILRCYLPDLGRYDGRSVHATITHIVHVGFGLQDGHGMLSMRVGERIGFDATTPGSDAIPRNSRFSIRWEDPSEKTSGSLSGACVSYRVAVVTARAYVEIFGPVIREGKCPRDRPLRVRVSLDNQDNLPDLRSIVVPGQADGVEFFDDRITMTVWRFSEEWVTQK